MQCFSCRDGGIGRRSGFKIRRRKVCGFESHSRHQKTHDYIQNLASPAALLLIRARACVLGSKVSASCPARVSADVRKSPHSSRVSDFRPPVGVSQAWFSGYLLPSIVVRASCVCSLARVNWRGAGWPTARACNRLLQSKLGRLGLATGLPALAQASKPPAIDLTCR